MITGIQATDRDHVYDGKYHRQHHGVAAPTYYQGACKDRQQLGITRMFTGIQATDGDQVYDHWQATDRDQVYDHWHPGNR